jgi:hypothetical protein
VEGNEIPEGWKDTWNCSFCPVIMGCTFAQDGDKTYVESIVVSKNSIENAWKPEALIAPTCTGYTFLGWATSAEGEVVYSMEQLLEVSEGMTLYAVWAQD